MHPLQPLLNEAIELAIHALARVCKEGSPTQARLAATRILSLDLAKYPMEVPARSKLNPPLEQTPYIRRILDGETIDNRDPRHRTPVAETAVRARTSKSAAA